MSKRRRPSSIPGNRGFEENPVGMAPIIENIGKLMINFGAIEFVSLAWIGEMVDDPVLYDTAVDMPLGKRIDVLLALIHREKLNDEWGHAAIRLWRRIKKLSEIRNIVAHGPILFSWKGREPAGEADVMGIPVIRHAKMEHRHEVPNISVQKLSPIIDEVAEVAKSLHLLFEEYRVARMASKGTDASSASA